MTHKHTETARTGETYRYEISLCGDTGTGAIYQRDTSNPKETVKIVGKHSKQSIYFGGGNEI